MTLPLINMRMVQPEAVLLSYLVGLGKVGEPIEISLKKLMPDLGLKYRAYFYKLLNRLIELHAVRRLACGNGGATTGLLVVLKRPEHVAFPEPKPHHWRSQGKWASFRASLNPEFRNSRSLERA